MSTYPLISVIIPTYCRANYLCRAVDSVLAQTYTNIEVIVVDDNAPESEARKGTQALMFKYRKDPRVRYLKHLENKNGAAARNTGLLAARGLWCCFLDDDDWYLPGKLLRQYEYLNEHPEYGAVYCGWHRENQFNYPRKTGDLTFELLSGIEVIYTNLLMIKRQDALECGGWDVRFCRNQEAVFLIRYFMAGGKIGAIPEVLVEFDTSDRRNVSDPQKNQEDFEQFLTLHDEAIRHCEERYVNAREIIYSFRYRGVLLTYIKHGNWSQAIKFYRQATKKLPKRFKKDCLIYFIRKLTGRNLFSEFEGEAG